MHLPDDVTLGDLLGMFPEWTSRDVWDLVESYCVTAKEGFWDIVPQIKSVSFPRRGKFQVDFMGGGISWDACPEVIHIEQILGDYQKFSTSLCILKIFTIFAIK